MLRVVNSHVNQGSIRVTRRNEGVLPPQSIPVGGRLCQFVEGWKRIMNDPFVLSIVAKGYTPSAADSLGDTIPPGDTQDPGNARANLPNASNERNLRNISRHSRVLFQRIPGTQSIWRVASSYRFKTTEPPHRHSSLSHAHYKLSVEYRRKRRLRIQDRSAGAYFHVPGTNTSRQQEVPSFCLRKQGIPVSSTSLRSEHCPSGIYSPGAYSGSLTPSSRDIGNPISRQLVNTSPRPPSITSPPVSVIKHTEYGWPQIKRSQIRTKTNSRYPVSGASVTLGSGESFPPSIQISGDNGMRVPNILPGNLVVHRSAPVDGSTQLGLRSHPIGSSTLEALTTTFSLGLTNRFAPLRRSDPVVQSLVLLIAR